MSYARKTGGYRGIIVDGTRYRWRYRADARHTMVTLQSAGFSGGQQAVARLRDCPDPWLAAPDASRWVLITPRLVRRMIQEALARGWLPTRRAPGITFDFVDSL